jgi:hypothetical protein
MSLDDWLDALKLEEEEEAERTGSAPTQSPPSPPHSRPIGPDWARFRPATPDGPLIYPSGFRPATPDGPLIYPSGSTMGRPAALGASRGSGRGESGDCDVEGRGRGGGEKTAESIATVERQGQQKRPIIVSNETYDSESIVTVERQGEITLDCRIWWGCIPRS